MASNPGRVPLAPGSREPDPQAVPALTGFDPAREDPFYDEEYDEREGEWCDRCQGSGIANCYCGGDQCYCENYGEMECPTCYGEGHFVPTEAFKVAREQNARTWRELHEAVRACDSDGSGEAGETRSGSTEGNSADPKGIAQPGGAA